MALVIKRWYANPNQPDTEGNIVLIECREDGVISFLLNLLNISPTTTIKVGSERVEFRRGSLEGYEIRMMPLRSICSTYYGYVRPVKQAIAIAAVGLLLGLGLLQASAEIGLLVMLLGIGASVLYYFLNKQLTLGFVEHSGQVAGIRVKRSVIENQKIEEDDARRVCEIVQLVIESRAFPTA